MYSEARVCQELQFDKKKTTNQPPHKDHVQSIKRARDFIFKCHCDCSKDHGGNLNSTGKVQMIMDVYWWNADMVWKKIYVGAYKKKKIYKPGNANFYGHQHASELNQPYTHYWSQLLTFWNSISEKKIKRKT